MTFTGGPNHVTNTVILVTKEIVCTFLMMELIIYLTMVIFNYKFTFKTGPFQNSICL